jgi:putative membrane protein
MLSAAARRVRNIDTSVEARAFVEGRFDAVLEPSNRPDAVIRAMGRRIGGLKSTGSIGPMECRILDERLCSMSALLAGCERMAGTPLPFA